METKIKIETSLGQLETWPHHEKFTSQILEMAQVIKRKAELKREHVTDLSFIYSRHDCGAVDAEVLQLIAYVLRGELEPHHEKFVLTRVLPAESLDWF